MGEAVSIIHINLEIYHRQQNKCYPQRCLTGLKVTLDFSSSEFTCP